MKNTISYISGLLRVNLRSITERPLSSAFFAMGMFAQDLFLFAGWAVFFGAVGRVNGWGMPEIFLLYGIIFCDYGIAAIFFSGIRHLGYKIVDGELDIYLTKPCNPLPALFITRCNPGGIGDILCGLMFLAFFAGLNLGQFCIAVIASILVSILFETMKLIFYSFNFFFNNGSRFGDYLTDALYYLTTVPQNGQSLAIKLILFTVMPAGFIALVPVKVVRADSLLLLGGLAVIVALYAWFSLWFFNVGVRRYKRQGAA